MSLKFGQIRLLVSMATDRVSEISQIRVLTAELAALERLKKSP